MSREPLDPDHLRAFAGRAWGRVADHKASYWVARRAEKGVETAFVAADELRAQMRSRDPAWPTTDDRRRDLANHARVAALLRGAYRD